MSHSKYWDPGYLFFCHLITDLTDVPSNAPIQPGIFAGSHGRDGFEVIRLTFTDETFEAVRITGDRSVPAETVLFKGSLSDVIPWMSVEAQR